jgi:hypothetical protein
MSPDWTGTSGRAGILDRDRAMTTDPARGTGRAAARSVLADHGLLRPASLANLR